MSNFVVYNSEIAIFEKKISHSTHTQQIAEFGDFATEYGYLIPLGDYSGVMLNAMRSCQEVKFPKNSLDKGIGARPFQTKVPRTGHFTGVLFNGRNPQLVTISANTESTTIFSSVLSYPLTEAWKVISSGDIAQDSAIEFALKGLKNPEDVVEKLKEILPQTPINVEFYQYTKLKDRVDKEPLGFLKTLVHHQYPWID